jgi:hypothetical protein
MPDVFISYSADAKKVAESLAESLRKEGLATWSDFENISAGERIYDQLQQALDQAKVYLLIVGPRNLMRDSQDREWQGALERTWTDPDRRIISVLVGHAEAPAFVRNWPSFRFRPGRGESALVKKLAEIIKADRPREETQPKFVRLGSDWRKRILALESAANQLKSQEDPSLAKRH